MQETREKLLSNMKILMNQAAQLEWGIFQQINRLIIVGGSFYLKLI